MRQYYYAELDFQNIIALTIYFQFKTMLKSIYPSIEKIRECIRRQIDTDYRCKHSNVGSGNYSL